MNNREKIHAKRINHVFKSAKTLDKSKRDKFIKLGLKLTYLDDKLENFFSDVKKRKERIWAKQHKAHSWNSSRLM